MGVVRKEISVFLTDEHANWSHSTKWSTLQVYTFKQHEKESWIWDRVEAVMELVEGRSGKIMKIYHTYMKFRK